MELGIYHEFPVLPGRSQAECFAAGFDIVDVSEEYGLDVMWLAELHFDKRRALAASPLVLGTAIAARTERIRIGTSVQVLPLANPLRIAEEAATLDHVSKGRLIFGVGRSGVVKTYEALNIAYSESKDREIECLEIIQRAWQEDNFSYKGKFYDIQDVTVVPQPVQQPTPEIRIAAVSVETFPAAGKAGQGLFLSVRHEDVRMFGLPQPLIPLRMGLAKWAISRASRLGLVSRVLCALAFASGRCRLGAWAVRRLLCR